MIVEYSSNNSGGDWWLSDDDWKNLESAGWKVKWIREDEHYVKYWKCEDGRWLKRFDIEEIVVDTPHHLLIEEIVNKMNRQRGLPR